MYLQPVRELDTLFDSNERVEGTLLYGVSMLVVIIMYNPS